MAKQRKQREVGVASVKSWPALCKWIHAWRFRGCPVKDWIADAQASRSHFPVGEYEEQKAKFMAYWCNPKSPAFPFFPITTREDVADKGEPGNLLSWMDADQSKAIVATDDYRRVLASMPPTPTLDQVQNVMEVLEVA